MDDILKGLERLELAASRAATTAELSDIGDELFDLKALAAHVEERIARGDNAIKLRFAELTGDLP